MDEKVKLVNVVGSGDLNRELDLEVLQVDLNDFKTVSSKGDSSKRLIIKFDEEIGTITLFRSGKYNIMGSSSVKDLYESNEIFLEILSDLGMSIDASEISIVNYVFSVNMSADIDLSELKSKLGTNAEYEPEQNPFITYRPDHINCTITISNSGKCVVNTPVGEDSVQQAVEHLSDYLEKK